MRYDPDNKEKKKEQILSATFRCVNKHGIDGMKLRDIAQAAKLNPALIHYYFKDKENLLKEFIDYLWRKLVADVGKQFRPSIPPEQKLELLFQAAENFITKQKPLFVAFVDAWSFCLRNPGLQETYANINRQMATLVNNILAEGIEQGVFNKVRTELIAYHFFALVVGTGIIWHTDNQSINLEEQFQAITTDIKQAVMQTPVS